MSRRDLRVEVSEEREDGGRTEVTQDGTLTGVGKLVTLQRKDVFLDQMPEVLLLQMDLNPQCFQFVFNKGKVVAGILTPSSRPSYLALDGLKLILHNLRKVITFLLFKPNSVPTTASINKGDTYLSDAMEAPMIIIITILVMLGSLK